MPSKEITKRQADRVINWAISQPGFEYFQSVTADHMEPTSVWNVLDEPLALVARDTTRKFSHQISCSFRQAAALQRKRIVSFGLTQEQIQALS